MPVKLFVCLLDTVLGELRREVTPGKTLYGYTYEEWRQMGDGAHEVTPKGRRREGDPS